MKESSYSLSFLVLITSWAQINAGAFHCAVKQPARDTVEAHLSSWTSLPG